MREEIGAYKIFLYVAAVYYWGAPLFSRKARGRPAGFSKGEGLHILGARYW